MLLACHCNIGQGRGKKDVELSGRRILDKSLQASFPAGSLKRWNAVWTFGVLFMATVICPSCGRINITDELAARGNMCELCRQTISLSQEPSAPPPPVPQVSRPPLYAPRPTVKGVNPVSRVCPHCGNAEYKPRKPERLIAFTWDRVCKACETRYTPPTPMWAAVVFLLLGFLLVGFAAFSILVRAASGNVLGIPAMLCEGFLGFLGLLAIYQGLRALIKPGKA